MNTNRIMGTIVAITFFLILCMPWLSNAEDLSPQDPGGVIHEAN